PPIFAKWPRLQWSAPFTGVTPMKLFFAATSPYVRKVMICAQVVGLADRIEKLSAAADPINRDPNIVALNPLGKVPTLTTDDGQVLYDSRVICEYLNEVGK